MSNTFNQMACATCGSADPRRRNAVSTLPRGDGLSRVLCQDRFHETDVDVVRSTPPGSTMREYFDEMLGKMNRLIAAQGAPPDSNVSMRLLSSIACSIEPDHTAVIIRTADNHSLTLCSLMQLRAIARMAIRSLPLETVERERMLDDERAAKRRAIQRLANEVRRQTLDQLLSQRATSISPIRTEHALEMRQHAYDLAKLPPEVDLTWIT